MVAHAVGKRQEEQVSALVFHLGRELRTALDRRLAEHGLTSQQAALLMLSRMLRQPNPIQMADRLGTDTAGMTRLIDRLESKGLVSRKTSPDDRRSIVIALGPKSRHVLPRLLPAFRQVESGLLDGFDEREVSALSGMLRRLLKNARNLNR
ncbi:MAG TPA: MarR family transcriptional regulator [Candidatus Dormibacteraeota bacterium]|jgi:DNA-binding MarR family transcriptional regulator|nr:MarR family transcriptional regulator [Candidatus Dormibacteraeota bacterium]